MPRGVLRRDRAVALALARATRASWYNLVLRSVGESRRAVRIVAVAVAVLGVVWNVALLSFLRDMATPAVGKTLPNGLPAVQLLTGALVQGAAMTAAAVMLVLVVFMPSRSGLTLSALASGASRRAVVVGQSIPLVIAAVLLGIGGQCAIIVWIAQALPVRSGLSSVVSTAALLVVAPLMVLGAFFAGQALGRAITRSEVASRMVGLLAAALPLLVLAVDLLRSASGTRPPAIVAALLDVGPLTRGDSLMRPVTTCLALLVLALGAVLLLAMAATPSGADTANTVVVRLPRSGVRVSSQAAIARELVLWIRHPVVQLGLCLWVLVAVGAFLLSSSGDGLAGAMALILVAVLALTAETAFGRTRPWHWLYRVAPGRDTSWFAPKVVAALFPIVALAPVVVVLMLPVVDWPAGVGAALAVGLLFGAGALLAGTVLPFNEAAPGAMAMTSLVSVVLGTGAMYLEGKVVHSGGALSAGVQLALAAVFLAAMRWRAAHA